jgi:hypothetical protein
MVINYTEVEVIYTKRKKLQQSMKLNEWAHNEVRKRKEEE